MTLEIVSDTDEKLPFQPESILTPVVQAILHRENCPYEAQISLHFVDDDVIRQYNREYRQTDAVTDVLSFPLVPFPKPADFGYAEEDTSCFDPDSGELCLGDILINVRRASEQAEEYGHSLLREIAFLTAHSMLHLLGYDHMTPEEASVMEEIQESVLQDLGITREAALS